MGLCIDINRKYDAYIISNLIIDINIIVNRKWIENKHLKGIFIIVS